MIAQVSLTPTESKKLIAKAVVQMPEVRRALKSGILEIRPGSSTYFIYQEITGSAPPTNVWVCGVIGPKGACIETAAMASSYGTGRDSRRQERLPVGWLFEKGKAAPHRSTAEIIARMGPGDVCIKSANAIDVNGVAGVLMGAPEGGGVALIMAAQKKQGYTVILPAGLEKLIPVSVKEAARETSRKKVDYSMGMACSLLPCEGGITVTEVDAVRILTGARAVPIAAGGLGGAEGSITMIVKGEKPEVAKAIEIIEQCKGARLPVARTPNCSDCAVPFCEFPIAGKHWVV